MPTWNPNNDDGQMKANIRMAILGGKPSYKRGNPADLPFQPTCYADSTKSALWTFFVSVTNWYNPLMMVMMEHWWSVDGQKLQGVVGVQTVGRRGISASTSEVLS
jgi:hypothetical protein